MPAATLLGKRKSVTAQPEGGAMKKMKRVAEDDLVNRIKQKTKTVAKKAGDRPVKKEKDDSKKEEKKEEDQQEEISDTLSIFQRAFEARFKPIAPAGNTTSKSEKTKTAKKKARKAQEDEDDDEIDEDQILEDDDAVDSGSEDDGFSGKEDEEEDYNGSDSEAEEDGEEEAPKVMVVDHSKDSSKVDTSKMSKKELKAYLSSKPPNAILDSASQTTTKSKKDKGDGADGDDSAAFLANDLALQRLIAESHILSAAGGNASHYLSSAAAETEKNTRAFAEGRIRKKTTDMRIQALGGKGSMLEQEKMPMNMRKGIKKAAETYEQKRRREARENGIILEKAKGKGGSSGGKRRSGDRPVDMPGIGKMRGAQLTISARDIRSMENSGPAGGRGGRGGRGGKVKGGHRKRR